MSRARARAVKKKRVFQVYFGPARSLSSAICGRSRFNNEVSDQLRRLRRATDPPRHPNKLCSLQDTILLYGLTISLLDKGEYAEVKSLIRASLPLAERALGSAHDVTSRLYMNLGEALYEDPRRSRDDVVEAVAILKSATKESKRTFGEAHPVFRLLKNRLLKARHERAFLDLEARYGEGSLKH